MADTNRPGNFGRKITCGGTTVRRPVPKSQGANNSRGGGKGGMSASDVRMH